MRIDGGAFITRGLINWRRLICRTDARGEPEHALGYVQGAGELWRKDRAAGRLLSVWWQAPAVRAWLVELAQCMVALDASASPEAHMRAQERRRRLLGDAHLAAIHSAAALEVTERA